MSATRRGVHYLAASASQAVFGVVSVLLVFPRLSNTELGYIAALETLTYLFATVAGLNLERAASRFYFNSESVEYRRNLVTSLNVLSLASIALAAILVYAGRELLLRVFPGLPFWPLMVLALGRICFEIAGRIELSYLIASGRSGLYGTGTVASGFVSVALALFLVVHLSYGVVGFLVAQVVAAVFLYAFLAIVSWRQRGWGRFEPGTLAPALSYAWPFMPTLGVAWVMSYYDRILVGRWFGLEMLGVYGLSLRFAAPVLLVCSSITKAIYPSFYALYGAEAIGARDRRAFARSVIYIFGVFGLGAMTMGRIVFRSVYGVRGEDALAYFVFIVVTYWVSSVGFISSESLMLAKATKSNMVLGVSFAGASLGLNYLLIPAFGIKGAIATGGVVAVMAFLAQLYLARRYVRVEIPAGSYAYVLAVLLSTAVLAAEVRAVWMDVALLMLGGVLLSRGFYESVRFLRERG